MVANDQPHYFGPAHEAMSASSATAWHAVGDGTPRPALVLTVHEEPSDSDLETERTARLRAELAAWVAAADLAIVQDELEKWRTLALERERALGNAKATVNVLSETIISMSMEIRESQQDSNSVLWPRPPELANVPPGVRDAVAKYRARRPASRPSWERLR